MDGRTTRAALLALTAAALGACGGDASPPGAKVFAAPSPAVTAAQGSARPPADDVKVGPLPESGVVVSARTTVWLLDVEGRVVRKLRGFALAGNPGAAGVWLARGADHFRLAAGRGTLVAVPRQDAREHMYDEAPPPSLRPPEEARGPVPGSGFSGRWRYAYERLDEVVLAQWSGECEVPTAYWREPGGRPEIVTGGHDLGRAPESFALGWAPDGRAVVQLWDGYCGTGGDPPGIYAFRSPGAGTLLVETPPHASADMWP